MTITLTCSCGERLVTQDMLQVVKFKWEHASAGHTVIEYGKVTAIRKGNIDGQAHGSLRF